jgi:hypothetical protein
MRVTLNAAILASALALGAATTSWGIGTSLPVSAELGTSIAREQFPLTVQMVSARLFLTNPTLHYIDTRRIGLEARFQAYDHRPEAGVAVSETGRAVFSGELDYDPATRHILLYRAKIDELRFDRNNADSRRLAQEVRTTWSEQISDPLRAKLPNHPYLLPFRDNINDIAYDGRQITISVLYQ